MKVYNVNGVTIDFEIAVNFMDDEIREHLHNTIAPCSEQKFFSAYEVAHRIRFGEEFIASQLCPAW